MGHRHLFVDLNGFFASVEQQERPELRGRPVGVLPVMAPTTCCIAASYEAKARGVTTGTTVRDAQRLCPDIRFVEARHEVYVRYHHAILASADTCLPVAGVHSIDEFSCRLIGREQEQAVELALRIKAAFARDIGPCVRCSIGLAPSVWLAKVASDMHKPDGLTQIHLHELPGRLYPLELIDLPGIGPRMRRRLEAQGVKTVEQLCALTEPRMIELWGSRVHGMAWWRRLRGDDLPMPPTVHRSVGHSRVLSPELRNDEQARQVLMCMLHKAATRMRRMGYWARSVGVSLSFIGAPSWGEARRVEPCRDTLALVRVTGEVWDRRPRGRTPLKVGVVLGDLAPDASVEAPLFPSESHQVQLAHALDRLNARYGPQTIYPAAMHGAERRVPIKVAFNHIPELEPSGRAMRKE